jgi:hypothetical protein
MNAKAKVLNKVPGEEDTYPSELGKLTLLTKEEH